MSSPTGPPGVPEHERVTAGAASTTSAADHFLSRDRTALDRIHGFLHRYEIGASAAVLVVACIVFAILDGSKFVDPFNISIVLQQTMVIGILAIAQTLVILTAGIDLSVGAIMVLSSVVMGRLAIDAGWPAPIALLAGLGIGVACGYINGVLVTRFHLPPFIATLGTLSVFFSLNLYISQSNTIRSQDIEAKASMLQWMGQSFNIGGLRIAVGVVMMIALFAIVWFALNWTSWGRHVYAVGNDPAAARLVGIRTNRVLLSVYLVAGVICAIAAWVFIGRIGSVAPQGLVDSNLDSITAAVIGGVSLFGGRGSVFGALIGALTVGVFSNGLSLYGLDVLWKQLAIGLLILGAVALDHWIRRVKA